MKIFPIIHTNENLVGPATVEADNILGMGPDGIYITDHYNGGVDKGPLFETFERVKSEHPESYIGINIFGLSPFQAVRAVEKAVKSGVLKSAPSGLWMDQMSDDGPNILAAIQLRNAEPKLQQVRLIGGIAYDYASGLPFDTRFAAHETEWAKDSVDVVLTRGQAQNERPRAEKLLAMKAAAGEKPLAVVGAVTVNGIREYQDLVDEIFFFSVAQVYGGIPDEFYSRRLKSLVEEAHKLAS